MVGRGLREQASGDAAAEEAAARRQREGAVAAGYKPAANEARELGWVDAVLQPSQRQRLVEAQTEHDALLLTRLRGQVLVLARRASAVLEGGHVAGERGRVAPAPILDCADRAHAEAEVVPSEPVAEVVLRPQVTPTGLAPAEARGLVPAVAGCSQRLDDVLEVRLHRVCLAPKLGSVSVREAGSGLRFQLVRGDVLGLERECLDEVAREVGGL